MRDQASNSRLNFAVDENPGNKTAAMLGFQAMLLIISGVALTPVIVLRGAGADAIYNSWVIFAALIVSGLTTILQGRPVWKFGSGYPLFMGTSGAFIAVGIAAVKAGGLPLLATLSAVSALFQFALSARLQWFRRIVTPDVGGVVVMLIVVTVFPICTDLMAKVPPEKAGAPAAITAGATFFIIIALALFGRGAWRLWGPLIGIAIGCIVAYLNGLFHFERIATAPLVGLPETLWPGMDLSFNQAFWSLLPGFIIVTMIGAIETFGDAISIQKVSHRKPRPTDFRVVQKALFTDGLGNFLSGLMATLPNTTYSTSISLVEFTGVAARRVAVFGGSLFVLLAFFPKVSALLQTVPNPVVGAYLIVILAILFISGLRLVAESGLDYERGLVISLAFWVGVAFQNQMVFPELMPDWMHALLDNGMTAGGTTAIVLNCFFACFRKKGSAIDFSTGNNPFPIVRSFLGSQGRQFGWDDNAIKRLELVGEEAILFLREGEYSAQDKTRLNASFEGQQAILEFATSVETTNLDGELQDLPAEPLDPAREAGLRILQAMTSRVEHQQFSDRSFLTITVENT